MAIAPTGSREIQLFEPPAGAVYTIEAAARLVDLPRRTILTYCKHRLLSPVIAANGSYSFDRNGIRTLRRIEALRPICGPDFAGIKIILALTEQLERLDREMRSLVAQELSPPKRKSKSNQQKEKK
ncbi:MAG TPA: MerR family transcriptional regulator [Candidatus Udaeobacter sp.]|nr:MerR family transcriptional regulator [Candidatus Udaeobacter sp.]